MLLAKTMTPTGTLLPMVCLCFAVHGRLAVPTTYLSSEDGVQHWMTISPETPGGLSSDPKSEIVCVKTLLRFSERHMPSWAMHRVRPCFGLVSSCMDQFLTISLQPCWPQQSLPAEATAIVSLVPSRSMLNLWRLVTASSLECLWLTDARSAAKHKSHSVRRHLCGVADCAHIHQFSSWMGIRPVQLNHSRSLLAL